MTDASPAPTPPLLGACLGGAGLVAIGELAALDWPSIAVTWVVLALFGGLGLGVAMAWRTAAWLVATGQHTGLRAAALLASPTLLVSLPASRRMFDGAFAATLPGAESGHLWAPALIFAATTAAVHVGRRLVVRHARTVGLVMLIAALALDLINRNVKTSELADLHTALLVATVVVTAVGFSLLPRGRALRTRDRIIVAGACLGAAWLAIGSGLQAPEHRHTVATSGFHTRLLVRAVRGAFDGDGDGYANVLGGTDCDDDDPSVHPGALDRTIDDVDQDCDGRDGPTDTTEILAPPPDAAAARAAWYASAEVRETLAALEEHDVLLITVDTLRADLLADTPDNRARYPNTFALLDESRVFTRAFAPSAGTDLSMSGLLTGRINPFEGADLTLAEAMQASGRRTLAVIPSETLRYVGKALLTRGFDEYERLINDLHEQDVGSYTTSHRTVDLALRMIDRHVGAAGDSPLFLWAHFFDLHEHHEIDRSDRRLRDAIGSGVSGDWAERYGQTYQLVDRELGRLVQELRDRGRWDRSIVVFASDHGESMHVDERLPHNHGLVLYQGLVHVPLAIRIPGVAPARVDVPTSLIDGFPTLLELVGHKPRAVVDGQSMLPHVLGPDAPAVLLEVAHPIPLHESDQVGVVLWPHKLLMRPGENLVELFDLAADPAEENDLAATQPELVRQLQGVYASFPPVHLDRTRRGRRLRERAAQTVPGG